MKKYSLQEKQVVSSLLIDVFYGLVSSVQLIKLNFCSLQLPRIPLKDAIAKYYALEKGQVVQVTYNSEITEFYVTYRCVW